jgi:hypothetical protein
MIEPLESRIAPAAIIFTATSFGSVYKNSKGVVELQFINAAHPGTNPDNIAIAKTVGDSSSVFFIEVTAGEDVKIPTPVGYEDLINVSAGTVVAFFTAPSSTASQPVLGSELTGLSLSTQVSVAIGNGINGDVVTNFNTKTGEIGGTSTHQLLANTVTDLSVAGSITGAFISGGNVARFEATGDVNMVLTGTAADDYAFSFNGGANKTVLSVPTPATGVAGPSISNLIIGSTGVINPANGVVIPGIIKLGNGGAGAVGGSLSGLILLDDTTGYTVQAGAGGAGGTGRAYGGAGGSISNVLVEGPLSTSPDTSANSPEIIQAGAGGAGVGTAGGGAGGAVQNVYVDFSGFNINDPEITLLADNVTVQGGAGGSGGAGGAGGTLNNVNVLTGTPHDITAAFLSSASPFEYHLLGGVGGEALRAGRGGAGGSITDSSVNNHLLPVSPIVNGVTQLPDDAVATSPTNTRALVQAGAGGASVSGAGGPGGAVATLLLRGYNFNVVSGAGGAGHTGGGAGGVVASVDVLGSTGDLPGDNFHDESLLVTAGEGGEGVTGVGGAGGAIAALTVQNADFDLTGMVVTAGDGGNGHTAGGAGGSITGGAVSVLTVTSVNFLTESNPAGKTGPISIASGSGGAASGSLGHGGVGGAMSNLTIDATRLSSVNVTTGSGGEGGVKTGPGFGGAGGTMTNVAIRSTDPTNTTASTGLLLDTTATFVTDKVAIGDIVENQVTGATTYVTAVTQTELTLASDIFATGDAYTVLVPAGAQTGTAQDSQNTIVDNTSNFVTEGVKVGDVVEDLTTVARNAADNENAPYLVTVTAVTANTLTVTGDISHVGDQYAIPAILTTLGDATFTAGAGGAGGRTGYAGAGGSILGSSASTPGTITFNGGAGGAAGVGAAAGAGGTLNGDGAVSVNGSGLFYAGNAGAIFPTSAAANAGRAGAGGSIIGANAQALIGVSMIAGNGTAGGAGGSVNQSGFSGAPAADGGLSLTPPLGNIKIQAGSGGSSLNRAGGAGGSINLLTGFISSGNGVSDITTQFDAGAGGSGKTAGGAGGSVGNVRIFGGGGADVTFFIDAGDAGNGTTSNTGATGGSVSNVGGGVNSSDSGIADFSINPLTDFHHISAGNGGNASIKGGLGGSVSDVYVNAAIGVGTGRVFGFNLAGAGGISAGAGGTGSKTHGQAGSVTTIAADSIASIIAGHLSAGQGLEAANLAYKVDGIILNGTVAPSIAQTVDFTFDGETTVTVPTNASAVQVADAINALPAVLAAGGVKVTLNGTSGYIVTFLANGAQTLITAQEPAVDSNGTTTIYPYSKVVTAGAATTDEVQNVQVFGINPFSLTIAGETTGRLAANATAAQVMTALNALPAVQDAGGVTVTYHAGTSSTNPSYTIAFNDAGAQSIIYPDFDLSVAETPGTATTPAVDTLTFPTRGDISPLEFSTANYVGSIYNILRPDATKFDYTGSPAAFKFGDAPIDGLIAALTLTANKNFVPEAFVTSISGTALLVDPLNS